MNWYKNWKISVKLITGFLLVAIIAGLVGLVGLTNIMRLDDADSLLYKNNTLGIKYMGDAARFYQRLKYNTAEMILKKDDSLKDNYVQVLNNYLNNVEENLGNYANSISSQENRQLYNELMSHWNEYKSHMLRAIEYAQKGDYDKVEEVLLIDSDKSGDAVRDSIANLVDYNAERAEERAEENEKLADSSMALSQGAAEQASSIEELTASIGEVSSQTKMNADNASQANDLAGKTKTYAVTGNEYMKEMLKAMDDINISSNNINRIIKVIEDIAFQTNILALNAAVEAARAGEHGRGFAVVAEEVRNLAGQSANAAKETTALIEDSIRKAEGGTKIAKETAEALEKTVEGVEAVSGLIVDISSASNEQAAAITQINQGIMQVSQVVQENSATSEESAAASEELSGQAESLKEMIGRFKVKRSAMHF